MKRLIVGIVLGCVLLVACTTPAEETDAKGDDLWELIGTQEINQNDYTEVRHKKTGCHYTFVEDSRGVSYTPMFKMNMGGTQMPYCTDK